ncbi:MAG: Ig-like domain-containing protein [Gemmatimonadota bacterium]
MRYLRTLLAMSGCTALLACTATDSLTSADPASTTAASLASSIAIDPAMSTVLSKSQFTLSPRMQNASGRLLGGADRVWSSSDVSVATVSAKGLVTSHAPGVARIFLVSGSKASYTTVTVLDSGFSHRLVDVTPRTATLEAKQTFALSAVVTNPSGHTLPNFPVTWTSSNSSVATIDTAGKVTGIAAGTVSIVANAGTDQAVAQLTVTPAKTVAAPTSTPTTAPAPPPAPAPAPAPAPITAPVTTTPSSAGTLFSGYTNISKHWPHIRTMMTDFYYSWTDAERTWAGAHYDLAMSGSGTSWNTVNPTVGHLPYTLEWTVLIPGTAKEGLTTGYYSDMVAWFKAHSMNVETAFLHAAGARRDSAGRAVATIWGSRRWMINPADAGALQYQMDRYSRIVANEGGAFVDEASSGDMLTRISNTIEYPTSATFTAPQSAAFAAVKRAMGGKVLMINTAEYRTDFDRANALAAGSVHMEMINNPLTPDMPGRWQWIESLTSSGVLVDMVTLYSTASANNMAATFPKGNYATSAQRMKMWELASYYMAVSSTPDNLALQLENSWSVPYSSVWLKAQEANVGHPVAARVLSSRGTDPLGQTYEVYTREMDRALVIARVNQGWGSHSYLDASAVRIPLPTTDVWLPLLADGTLGAPVTSVSLRNVEAMVLVKKSRI